MMSKQVVLMMLLPFLLSVCVQAREIHVAKTGSDNNPVDAQQPFLTINKAAQVAQPGDIVTVHAGVYREWVIPARGGTSDKSRIIYRAAPDGAVAIKGSNQITGWTSQGNGIWEVEVPNSLFGGFNPSAGFFSM